LQESIAGAAETALHSEHDSEQIWSFLIRGWCSCQGGGFQFGIFYFLVVL